MAETSNIQQVKKGNRPKLSHSYYPWMTDPDSCEHQDLCLPQFTALNLNLTELEKYPGFWSTMPLTPCFTISLFEIPILLTELKCVDFEKILQPWAHDACCSAWQAPSPIPSHSMTRIVSFWWRLVIITYLYVQLIKAKDICTVDTPFLMLVNH